METIRLHKGLNLNLDGQAQKKVLKTITPEVIAVLPSNFKGVTPRLLVAEGDTVKAGQFVFIDKKREQIGFSSPVSGKVKAIVRGEKRKLLAVEITPDSEMQYVHFEPIAEVSKASREDIQQRLLESGLWANIIQRPYGIIANPADTPKAIVISAFNSAPLSADINFTIKDDVDAIQIAVNALSKFTNGKVYINVNAEGNASPMLRLQNAEVTKFKGAHPAGNVGIQIAHLCPIGKGDIVWTTTPKALVAIGKLLSKGVYDVMRTIAVGGNRAQNPAYLKALPGTPIKEIAQAVDVKKEKKLYGQNTGVRYISGNPLCGDNVGEDGFLGFYDDTVSLISEGNYREVFGWAKPLRPNKFSFSRSYFSWLTPKRVYKVDSNTNGGVRPFVVSGLYEKVLPMDIYPVYLLKAIVTEDIEKMEQLGIYEVLPEDLALCEYVCPSKQEVCKIIENGIDLMLKEMA